MKGGFGRVDRRRSVQVKICEIVTSLLSKVDKDSVLVGVDCRDLDYGFDWSLVLGFVGDMLDENSVDLADELSKDELERIVIEDLYRSLIAIRNKCDKLIERAKQYMEVNDNAGG